MHVFCEKLKFLFSLSFAILLIPPRAAKFSNVYHLTCYFPANFGSDTSCLYYLGFKGESSPLNLLWAHQFLIIYFYEIIDN